MLTLETMLVTEIVFDKLDMRLNQVKTKLSGQVRLIKDEYTNEVNSSK